MQPLGLLLPGRAGEQAPQGHGGPACGRHRAVDRGDIRIDATRRLGEVDAARAVPGRVREVHDYPGRTGQPAYSRWRVAGQPYPEGEPAALVPCRHQLNQAGQVVSPPGWASARHVREGHEQPGPAGQGLPGRELGHKTVAHLWRPLAGEAENKLVVPMMVGHVNGTEDRPGIAGRGGGFGGGQGDADGQGRSPGQSKRLQAAPRPARYQMGHQAPFPRNRRPSRDRPSARSTQLAA